MNKIRSLVINKLLITIPIKIENLTRPCLYSFFQGRKKVLSIKGNEKTPKKALSREAKKRRMFRGASKYQNFKKMKGNLINSMGSLPFQSFTRRRVPLV